MTTLRIDVEAVGRASLTSVFKPMVAASAQAQRDVEAMFAKTAAAAEKGAAAGAKAEIAATKSVKNEKEAALRELSKLREKENEAILKDVRRIEKEEERARANVAKIRERYFREEQRRGEQADRAAAARNQRVGTAAMRTFGGYLAAGAGVARDVAGGLGVDLSLAGGLQRSVTRDSLARDISVQGFRGRPGEVAQDPKELLKTAEDLGEKLKIDPTKVLAGLSKFQALTGDLDTGKAALADLGTLSKAFNIDLDKMVGAAGQVSSALGDVGEGKEFATAEAKAKALLEVMKGATAQGQEGAIEVADLTSQYAKLKGAGIRFEGDTGKNILKMSALAQMSYQMGGAGSVYQASNSVMAFVNTLSTGARRKEFKAAGVDIDSKEAGKFVDPYEIIKRSLKATGGDTDKMKAMFANVLGEKAVNALSAAYRGAGGGDKGIAAVDAQFNRFNGTVTDQQLKTNLATQMGSKESDAQEFQNELDKVTSALGTELAPALKDLAPYAISAAKALAGLVEFGAAHPGAAVAAALVASIGKAAIGEAIGPAIAGVIAKTGMAGGLAIGLATIAVTAAVLQIQKYEDTKDKTEKDIDTKVKTSGPELVKKAQEELDKTGTISKDTIDEIAKQRAEMEGWRGVATSKTDPTRVAGADQLHMTSVLVAGITGDSDALARTEGMDAAGAKNKNEIGALAQKMDALIAAYKDSKPKGPMDVNIVGGIPGTAGPGVNQAARSDKSN